MQDLKKRNSHRKLTQRQAFLLLLILLVLPGITLTVLSLTESMFLQHEESILAGQYMQARFAADSGMDAARLFLSKDTVTRKEAGGVWDNPAYFQAANVYPDTNPERICNFSIVAPNLDEQGYYSGSRFGLQNESSKLNLNALVIIDEKYQGAAGMQQAVSGLMSGSGSSLMGAASGTGGLDAASSAIGAVGTGTVGRQLLMGLPGMTEEIADAILDWIDADDEAREYGAESSYYSQLSTPYSPANGPMQSVEELLLVRGVTPQLLFGNDLDRNGVLLGSELTSMSTSTQANPATATSSTPNLGWAQYLTLYSREKNMTRDGKPRVNVNGQDMTQLKADLTEALGNEDWATYIIAYRANGGSSSNGAGDPNAAAGGGLGGGGGGGGGNNGPGRGGNGDGNTGPGGGQGGGPGRGNGRGNGPGRGQGGGGQGGGQGGGGQGGGPGRGNGNGPGGNPGGGGFGPRSGGGGQGGGRGQGGGGRGGVSQNVEPSSSTLDRSRVVDLSVPVGKFVMAQRGGQRPGGQGGGGGNPGGGGFGARPGGQGGQGQGGGPGFGGQRPGGQGQGPGGQGPGGQGPGGQRPGRGNQGRGNGGPGGGGNGNNGNGNGGGGGTGGGGTGAQTQVIKPWSASEFAALDIDLSQPASATVGQILELVGSSFTANVNGEEVTYQSPFGAEPLSMIGYLPTIMDKLTTVDSPILPGRININECPREILAGIPGLTTEIVDQLVSARADGSESENRQFETWPLVEGYVSIEQMRMLAPLLTAGGDVFRGQIVGYYESGAAFARIDTVIDAAESPPKVISYRRLDQFARGFSQTLLGQRSMAAGGVQ